MLSIRVDPQGKPLTLNNYRPTGSASPAPSFQSTITMVEDARNTELKTLADKMDEAGKRLAQNITFANLHDFKLALKTLLIQISKNFGLNSEHLWTHQGHQRILTTITKIDKHVEELTEEITSRNASSISILNKIGEIKGLLIDIYS